MTYIDYANFFWHLDEEHEFSDKEIALYFFLLKTCNRLSWKNPFGQSNAKLISRFNWGKTSFDTAKNKLKKVGLIDFKAGDGRSNVTQYTLKSVKTKQKKELIKGTPKSPLSDNLSPHLSNTLSTNLSAPKPATSIDIDIDKDKEVNKDIELGSILPFKNSKPKKATQLKVDPAYQPLVDFWLKDFHTDWSFGATEGKKLKSLILKIRKSLNQPSSETAAVVERFKLICHNLPEWYKDKDLSVLDSKYNEITAEIKTILGNGHTKLSTPMPFISKAKEMLENNYVLYENGSVYQAQSNDVKRYRAGEIELSFFDFK